MRCSRPYPSPLLWRRVSRTAGTAPFAWSSGRLGCIDVRRCDWLRHRQQRRPPRPRRPRLVCTPAPIAPGHRIPPLMSLRPPLHNNQPRPNTMTPPPSRCGPLRRPATLPRRVPFLCSLSFCNPLHLATRLPRPLRTLPRQPPLHPTTTTHAIPRHAVLLSSRSLCPCHRTFPQHPRRQALTISTLASRRPHLHHIAHVPLLCLRCTPSLRIRPL